MKTVTNNNQIAAFQPAQKRYRLGELVVLFFGFILALYFVARYNNLWLDEAGRRWLLATNLINNANLLEPSLNPAEGSALFGFGYQFLLKVLADFTGITPLQLFQLTMPLLLPVVAVGALAYYRATLPASKLYLWATLFWLTQPDLVVGLLRGGATTFCWLLIFLLTNLFYRLIFVDISLNNALAFVIIYAGLLCLDWWLAALVLIVLLLLWLVAGRQFNKSLNFVPKYLLASLLASGGLLTICYFFIYGVPSSTATISDSTLAGAWGSLPIYIFLTGLSWLWLAASLAQWLVLTLQYFKKPDKQKGDPLILFSWVGYTISFGLLLLLVIMNVAGFVSAALVWRALPLVLLFGLPLALQLIAGLARATKNNSRLATPILTLLLIWAAIAAALSSTNEPSLSQRWLFYTPAEVSAFNWSEQYLNGQLVWTGVDDRLSRVFPFYKAANSVTTRNNYYGYTPLSQTCCLFISQISRLQASRLNLILPDSGLSNKIYDNGTVQLYRTSLMP